MQRLVDPPAPAGGTDLLIVASLRDETISCHPIFPNHSIRRLHRIQIGGFAIVSQQQLYRRSIFSSDK